ncbi:MAG: 4-phosphopantetheinyl transferase family protein [Clostridia bacterium]|nr:4-phosphopantetheinyl transferase family protein [Clostridia bacterium]
MNGKQMKNKTVICIFKYDQNFDTEAYLRLYSPLRREKLASITDPEAKKQSAAAELAYIAAVKAAMKAKIIGCNRPSDIGTLFNYAYDKNGKPTVDGAFIGISHTPGAAAAFVSTATAGIDIERVRKTDERIARRIMCNEEFIAFEAAANKDRHLITVWTVKEAFLKMTGEGLGGSMNRIRIKNARCVVKIDTDTFGAVRTKTVRLDGGEAVLSLVSKEKNVFKLKTFSSAERIISFIETQ